MLKGSYGQFWLYPGADLASGLNPNAATVVPALRWTADPNGNGVWDPGEEGALLAFRAVRTSTAFDQNLKNTYTRQATAYVEREVAANFGVRTGFVWNGRRQVRGTVNVNRPLDAYTVPVTFRDPGADGRVNTADDGGCYTGYNSRPSSRVCPS